MSVNNKINLTEEKETLFITLQAKALDYHSKHSVLNDRYADDILKSIDYNFTKLEEFSNNITVVRAKHFDEWIKEFIQKNKNAVVVYLGCGLDTRIKRIDLPLTVNWFDVDYPDVIELRKSFFTNNGRYNMIASSVIGSAWLKEIPKNRPVIIVAEGLLEYLLIEEVKTLFNRLADHFNNGEIIFDVMNSFAIKSGKEKLKQTTGAVHKWAVDNIKDVDALNIKLKRIEALSVFQSPYVKKLSFGFRLLYSSMALVPAFKNMIRLLHYSF
jgi:O-methyltransferase involved in polyketide biosynthesis